MSSNTGNESLHKTLETEWNSAVILLINAAIKNPGSFTKDAAYSFCDMAKTNTHIAKFVSEIDEVRRRVDEGEAVSVASELSEKIVVWKTDVGQILRISLGREGSAGDKPPQEAMKDVVAKLRDFVEGSSEKGGVMTYTESSKTVGKAFEALPILNELLILVRALESSRRVTGIPKFAHNMEES